MSIVDPHMFGVLKDHIKTGGDDAVQKPCVAVCKVLEMRGSFW